MNKNTTQIKRKVLKSIMIIIDVRSLFFTSGCAITYVRSKLFRSINEIKTN